MDGRNDEPEHVTRHHDTQQPEAEYSGVTVEVDAQRAKARESERPQQKTRRVQAVEQSALMCYVHKPIPTREKRLGQSQQAERQHGQARARKCC